MNAKLTIPFSHMARQGLLIADYKKNPGAVESGFDALNVSFDRELCTMYPTVHAFIESYEGTGYRTDMAFVQIITRQETLHDETTRTLISCDNCFDALPFFAYGYPPAMYDAPCHNLNSCKKLLWTADTFLVTTPSRMNSHTVSFLAGFSWGYSEWDNYGSEVAAEMLPIKEIQGSVWNSHLELLRKDFPAFNFSKHI